VAPSASEAGTIHLAAWVICAAGSRSLIEGSSNDALCVSMLEGSSIGIPLTRSNHVHYHDLLNGNIQSLTMFSKVVVYLKTTKVTPSVAKPITQKHLASPNWSVLAVSI